MQKIMPNNAAGMKALEKNLANFSEIVGEARKSYLEKTSADSIE
jgi:hypothetical protein